MGAAEFDLASKYVSLLESAAATYLLTSPGSPATLISGEQMAKDERFK
jgi:hypothetical protein